MVALDAGVLQMIGQELRPTGERLVGRELSSGKFYTVDRTQEWTAEEETQYVAEIRVRLLGLAGFVNLLLALSSGSRPFTLRPVWV